jgi:hypothetical protein
MVGDFAPCQTCRALMSQKLLLCRKKGAVEPGPSRITYYAVIESRLTKYRPKAVTLIDGTTFGGGFTWVVAPVLNRNVYKAYCVATGGANITPAFPGGKHASLLLKLYPQMKEYYLHYPNDPAVSVYELKIGVERQNVVKDTDHTPPPHKKRRVQ